MLVNYCKKYGSVNGESTAWGLKRGHVIKFFCDVSTVKGFVTFTFPD